MPVNNNNATQSGNGSQSMSADLYKKYEQSYKQYKRTGKYGDTSWMKKNEVALFNNIRQGNGRSAKSGNTYYYMDNDTYDKYGRSRANWASTGEYGDTSWMNQNDLNAYKAIRGSRSQQDNAFDDFRYSLNDDVVKAVQDKYKSQWGDKYYYDITDPDDVARMNAGQMPGYLQKKYKANDPYDRWLLENGLPYSSAFNDMYSDAVHDMAEQQQKEALKQAEEDEKRQSTYTAAYNSVADYMNGMKGFAEGLEAGQSVEDLLATGKYDAILGYYNSKKPDKEYANEFEKYAAEAAKKNPVYDKAYDAIINGKVPDQEFFDTYKEKDWQQYLKDKLSFSDDDLEMSKVIGTVNSAKEKYGMADKIDLLSRVPVSKRDLENAGWETDKKYTTLNTQIESSIDDEGNAKYTVFTTIDPDGKILTKKEYDKYIKEYWKTGADPRNLVLGSFDDKDQASVYADRLDKHQTKAYQLDAENYEELRDKARQDWLKTIEDPAERTRYEQSFAYEEIQENNAQIKELEKERKGLSRHAQVDEHGFPVESEEPLALLSQINALKERNNQLYSDISAGSRELEREEMKTADLDQLEAEVEAVYAGYNAKTDRIAEIESEIAGLNAEAMEAKGSGEDVGPYLDRIQELNAEAEQLRGEVADEAKTLDDSGETQRYQRAKAYQLVQSELDKNIRSVEAVDIRGMEGLSVDAQELYWEFVNKLNPEAYDEYTTGIGIVVKNNGAYENEHTMSVDAMEKGSYASDEEMQTALGLMQTDPARAAEYLESLNLLLSMRANENREDEIAKFAREAPGLASALSVPANIIGGFEGMGVLTGTTQADVARFNAPALMFSSTVRGTVSEQIQESNQHVIAGTNITWGDVGSFLYGTGMSMVDSAARAAIATATGGASSAASWTSLAVMGSGVAGQTILDSMDKGATTGQALWLGTVAGSIEILTEKVSLTNFFELTASASGRELLANTLKQMMSEAKEEMIAEVVNSIAQLTSGWDEADFIKQVQEYMETHEGVSKAWAITAVLGINTGEAGLGGALSGLGFGAVGAVRETNQYSGKTFRDKMRTVGVYREVNAIDTPTYLQMVADIRATNMDQEYKDAIINLLDEIRMNPQIAGIQSVQDQLRRVQADLRDQNLVDVRFNNIMDEKTANANKAVRKSMMAITAGQQKAQELIAAGDSAGARTVIAKTGELVEAFKSEQESINKRLQNSNIQRQQNTIKANEAAQKLIDETRTTYEEAVGSATIAEQLLQKGITNDSVINEAAERATEVDQGAVGVIPETDEGKGFRADPRNEAVRGVREADANDLRLYGKSQTDLADKLGTDDVGAMTPAKALSQAVVDLANKFYDITGYKLGFFEGNTAAGINDGKSRIGANLNGDIIFTGFHEIYELNLGTETMADAMERLEKLPFFQDMVNRYVEAYNKRITDAYGENAKADPELVKGELIQDMGALFACNRYFDSMYDPAILFIPDGANLTRAEYLDIARNAADMMLEISDILINTAEHGQLSEQYNAQYYKSTPEAATVEEVANSEPVALEPGEAVEQPDNAESGFSYVSMVRAAGLDVKDEDVKNMVRGSVYNSEGNQVDRVTVEDIRNSPIGVMINESYHAGLLGGKPGSPEAIANRDYQEKLFSKLLSIMVKTGGTQAEQNFVMAQNFIGSALFTSMKTNSDKQYSFTHDFVSICVKTQAFIDHISEMMVHDGKSLSDVDIIAAYNKVFESNLPVSCPECYVLSRWIGIGSLLDNINRYQERFGTDKMTAADVVKIYYETLDEVQDYLDKNPKLEGKLGRGKGALAEKYDKAMQKTLDALAVAKEKGDTAEIEKLTKEAEEWKAKHDQVKALAWISNVYFGNDGYLSKRDSNKKISDYELKKAKTNTRAFVPKDVLFDLNKGEAFSKDYQEAWAFRTTQGAGYGKAITPSTESVLGEDIMVLATGSGKSNYIKQKQDLGRKGKAPANPFMDMSQTESDEDGRLRLKKSSKAATMLKRARAKQLIQAFLGGQRWQSTSDARPEYATDYLLSALQDQAMGAMGQSYTKVESAVHALTNWGADPNMSIMPYGNGFAADGVTPKDTATGGMNPKKAQQLRKENERAGTITIGVNDKHIRALYNQVWRDFIIPYHASGGRADMIASMRAIQDRDSSSKAATRSCDYTSTQGDKMLSDSALHWVYTSESEDAVEYRQQHGIQQLTEDEFQAKLQTIYDTREMRKWILTRGKGGKNHAELLDKNSDKYNYILDRLYHRINDEGSIWKDMGGISTDIFQSDRHFQIFPNEFWDQDTTYDTSYINTEAYLYYCESLGVLHRFSGRVPRGVGKGITALKRVNGFNEKGEKAPMTDLAYKVDENGNFIPGEIEPFYWKNLVDRRMYGNQGQYLDQQRMTVGKADDNTDMYDDILSFGNVADYDEQGNRVRKYRQVESMASAKEIANMTPEERRQIAESSAAKNIIERMVNGNKKGKAPVRISSQNAVDLSKAESADVKISDLVPGFQMVSPVFKLTDQNNEFAEKELARTGKDYRNYLTRESIERYANDPKYRNWKHPDLAFISAASRDNVNIPADVLAQIPEIQKVQDEIHKKTGRSLDDYRDDMRVPGTNRTYKDLREEFVSKVLEFGSAENANPDGPFEIKKVDNEEQFGGEVRQDHKAAIILGLPGGGKSSVFANPLSYEMKARIMDSDAIKPWYDSEAFDYAYDGGIGDDYVHRDADSVVMSALWKAAKKGDNLIIPKVGGPYILGLINDLVNDYGYNVDVHLCDVSKETSITRAASRFAEKGRSFDLDYLAGKDYNDVVNAFASCCESGIINPKEVQNNDGKQPKRIPWREFLEKHGYPASTYPAGPDERGQPGVLQRSEKKGNGTPSGYGTEGPSSIIDDIVLGSDSEAPEQGASSISEQGYSMVNPVASQPVMSDDEYLELAKEYDKAPENQKELDAKWWQEERLQREVEKAAKAAGFPTPMLFHGTPSFGWTEYEFKPGKRPYIYTSTSPEVSAHYAGDRNYASRRNINRKYDGGNSLDSIIKDAKSVSNVYLEKPTRETLHSIISKDLSQVAEVEDKLNKLLTDNISYPGETEDMEISNAVACAIDVFYIIYADGIYDVDSDTAASNILGDEDVRNGIKEYLENTKRWRERNLPIVKEYYDNHYEELNDDTKQFLLYVIGFDSGDAAINVLSDLDLIINKPDRILQKKNQDAIVDADSWRDYLDLEHQIGSYKFYGDPGERPFEFDADEKSWTSVRVPEISDEPVSTRQICKWAKENGYTSVIMHRISDYGPVADNYVFFSPDQIKSADPVTFRDDGSIIPLSERFNRKKTDVRYSLTNFPAGLTAEQRAQMLKASRERVHQQKQNDLAEMMSEMAREVKSGRKQAEALENRIRSKDETLRKVRQDRDQKIADIRTEYRDAAAAERAEFNRKTRAMKAEEAAKLRQQRANMKSRARRAKLVERIEQNVRDLYQWRTGPDLKKGKYVPDALTSVVDDMMMSIDFGSTKREGGKKVKGWRQNMQNLRSALDRYQLERNGDIKGERYDASLDLPDGFLDLVGYASSMVDDVHLQDYDAKNQEQMDQLELLDTIVSVVKSAVYNVNKLKANKRYATLAEAGKAFLDEVEGRKAKRQIQNKVLSMLDNLVSVEMMDAPSFAQRIGSTGGSFINNIMDGFLKGTTRVHAAQDYMTEAKARNGIDNKSIREWSNEKVEYDTDAGEHLAMSRMQLMELYALSKREQAMRHILGGGIDLARNKASWDSQNKSYKLTYGDLDNLFSKLTDQQKDFVDDMQAYLSNEVSEWGNEVTRDLYGTTFYNEEFYWPIKSTKTAIEEQAPDSTRMQNAVLNMSASKAINKLANNPIVIDDVLTTFCNHVSQMANYNGMAIPLSDALKFWNFRDRNDDGSVNHNRNTRRAVINLLGQGGASWFSNFMKDVNGLSEGGTGTSIPNWLVSNMKAAAVAGKLRVVIQQPTAVVRATSMINPKYFLQSGGQSLKATIEEMQSAAPIAWWKAQGNFDIGTGKSIRSIIVGDGSVKDQITNTLMTPAGLADDFGWAMIWNAAKAETKAHHPNLSQEELIQKTAERFTDVINKTQVIDTVMHRSQIMRSTDSGVKQSTAFMSEPIKTFNMLYNAAYNAAAGQPGGKKQLAKTVAAVIASWAFNAAVLALHDSFRDREDGQKLEDMIAEKLVSEFISNANPINSIPYVKDVASIMNGYDSNNIEMSGIGDLIKSGQSIAKAITTGESNYTTYGLLSNFAKAGSEITGLPVAGLLSSVETVWNGVAPGTLPKRKMTSAQSTRQQLYDAGLDKKDIYELMTNGMPDVAEKTGLTKTTNAVKALAIATADANNDGVPDFSDSEMNMIAEVLGIKSYTKKPEKYGNSFTQFAIETAQDSVDKGKLSPDVLDYYMELLG